MADRMTDSNGNPLQTPDGKPMFIEKSVQTVEMTGEVCGHIYYLDGPDKRASSTDATREDIVDEADRINADRATATPGHSNTGPQQHRATATPGHSNTGPQQHIDPNPPNEWGFKVW